MAGIGENTFFVYDTSINKKEEDDPQDAIVYFHPNTVSIDQQCMVCGQLVGAISFIGAISASPPTLIQMKRIKFAVSYEGVYIIALAGSLQLRNKTLRRRLGALFRLFVLFHGSITKVYQESVNRDFFLCSMKDIWTCYLRFIHRHGNSVMSLFESIPTLNIPKNLGNLFLRASQILQSCRRHRGILAGCILYKNSIMCNELPTPLLSSLLIQAHNCGHLPFLAADTDFPLPKGIAILPVYLRPEEFQDICSQVSEAVVTSQQSTLTSHQSTLTGQQSALASQQSDLISQQSILTSQQSNLTGQQSDLTSQQSILTNEQSILTSQQSDLTGQQSDLTSQQSILTSEQFILTSQQSILTSQQSDLTGQQSDLTSQQLHLTSQQLPLTQLDQNLCKNTQPIPRHNILSDDFKNSLKPKEIIHPVGSGKSSSQKEHIPQASDKHGTQNMDDMDSIVCDGKLELTNTKIHLSHDSHSDRNLSCENCESHLPSAKLTEESNDADKNLHVRNTDMLTFDPDNAALENVVSRTHSQNICNHASNSEGQKLSENSTQVIILEDLNKAYTNHRKVTEGLSALDSKSQESSTVTHGSLPPTYQKENVKDSCAKAGVQTITHHSAITGDYKETNCKRTTPVFDKEQHRMPSNAGDKLVLSVNEENLLAPSVCDSVPPPKCKSMPYLDKEHYSDTTADKDQIDREHLSVPSSSGEHLYVSSSSGEHLSVPSSSGEHLSVPSSSGEHSVTSVDRKHYSVPSVGRDHRPVSSDVEANVKNDSFEHSYDKDFTDSTKASDISHVLKKCSLYVQAHSEMVLLLIMDYKLRDNSHVINKLWKMALPLIGDLEAALNQVPDSPLTMDETKNYRFLQVNEHDQKVQGLNYDVKSQATASLFHSPVQMMSNEFTENTTITDITVRTSESVIYGHKSANTQTFFQPAPMTWPIKGIPSPRDLDFCLEQRTRRKLHRDHNINVV